MSQLHETQNAQEETNNAEFWNHLYEMNISPWDTGKPDRFLQRAIHDQHLPRGSAMLDIGCGTGTNTIWLSQQGFQVVGVDISHIAIERARTKGCAANAKCEFILADILSPSLPNEQFDFAFDLGCFHEFDLPSNRFAFGHSIATLLKPGGRLLSISGSMDGPALHDGPPRRSLREITEALEPYFCFLSIQADYFDREGAERSLAWICVMERRKDLASMP